MTKAFGYLRVSSDGQVDGDGFPRQRAAIEKWAAENGVVIVQWFTEEGISGAIENRPALERMRIALLSNGVKMVVIEKLDRIARDVLSKRPLSKICRREALLWCPRSNQTFAAQTRTARQCARCSACSPNSTVKRLC